MLLPTKYVFVFDPALFPRVTSPKAENLPLKTLVPIPTLKVSVAITGSLKVDEELNVTDASNLETPEKLHLKLQ